MSLRDLWRRLRRPTSAPSGLLWTDAPTVPQPMHPATQVHDPRRCGACNTPMAWGIAHYCGRTAEYREEQAA